MRHFLQLPKAIPRLPGRVLAPSPGSVLMRCARTALRLPPRSLATVRRAVDLPTIAEATDQRQPAAARATKAAQRRQLVAQPAARTACSCAMNVTACSVESRGSCQGCSMRRGPS